MNSNPLVSVIIPVYNGERYLDEAIGSVLAQTYQPIEIIVIDDGSTDGSADVAKRCSTVRYCVQENQGIGAARNHGVDLARGTCVAFLDADDVWTQDKLAYQMEALQNDPTVDVVFGYAKEFQSVGSAQEVRDARISDVKAVPGHIPSAMLVTKQAFHRAGPFESKWRVGEFADWYLHAMEKGLRMTMLPNLVVWRRVHGGNNGVRQREAFGDYVRILKASLDRRRAAQSDRRGR